MDAKIDQSMLEKLFAEKELERIAGENGCDTFDNAFNEYKKRTENILREFKKSMESPLLASKPLVKQLEDAGKVVGFLVDHARREEVDKILKDFMAILSSEARTHSGVAGYKDHSKVSLEFYFSLIEKLLRSVERKEVPVMVDNG